MCVCACVCGAAAPAGNQWSVVTAVGFQFLYVPTQLVYLGMRLYELHVSRYN